MADIPLRRPSGASDSHRRLSWGSRPRLHSFAPTGPDTVSIGERGNDRDGVFTKARNEISLHKDFRVAVRSVTVNRDEEIGRSLCTINLRASWDPRLSPLLIQQGAMFVKFAKDASGKSTSKDTLAQGPVRIVGRKDAELTIQVPAPLRSSPQVDLLKGQFTLTTPAKMSDFAFNELKPDRKIIEGVTVVIDKVSAGPDRLSVELTIDNPKGTPNFETFQTSVWLENNKIVLEKGQGNAKQSLTPNENDEELLEPLTPLRARIRYHFKVDRKALGKLEEWRLVYSTPGPIVEVTVPFELKNIPLP